MLLSRILYKFQKFAKLKLRIIAIIHDTFKYKVDRSKPKEGENHHGMLARRFAEKFITSADSRFAAASKEIRVLVESSANRLTIVRPRNVGSFLTAPSLTRDNSVAVSKMDIASDFVRSDIESRWRIIRPPLL
jgi:hypothetical protein